MNADFDLFSYQNLEDLGLSDPSFLDYIGPNLQVQKKAKRKAFRLFWKLSGLLPDHYQQKCFSPEWKGNATYKVID